MHRAVHGQNSHIHTYIYKDVWKYTHTDMEYIHNDKPIQASRHRKRKVQNTQKLANKKRRSTTPPPSCWAHEQNIVAGVVENTNTRTLTTDCRHRTGAKTPNSARHSCNFITAH